MRSIRILHAFKVYRPDVEGGVPEVIGQITGVPRENVNSSILVARQCGWGRSLDVGDVPVKAVASFGNALSMPLAPCFPIALARMAREADVVALHAPFPLNDVGVALGIPAHIGVVVHWHSDIVRQRLLLPVVAPFIRRTLARADRIVVSSPRIIALSPFLRSWVEKCVVIPFGVDHDYWSRLDPGDQAEVERIRTAHGRLVVAVGRIVPYKGFDVLIRALRDIDATVVIVGEGPEGAYLRRLAKRCGVAGRIEFVGRITRNRLKLYLHAARVFAFPSITPAETFGIAQLEAMAVGLPIVNTALPTGVPDVARDGLEALTVAPGDAHALAAAIDRLLADPVLADKLGKAGRRRVKDGFDQRTFTQRINALYEEVYLGARAGVRR